MTDQPTLPAEVWSHEAEVGVLGAALIDPDAIDAARTILAGPTDFFRDGHRVLWDAVVTLRDRGDAVDPLTLRSLLGDRGELEVTGGMEYIADLIDAVPHAGHVSDWAGIVADKARIRRLIVACQTTMRDALETDNQSPEQVFEAAERRIMEAGGTARAGGAYRHVRDVLWDAMRLIETEANARGGVTGIPTGFPGLDRMTAGMQPGDLTILAARPAMGKTALAQGIAMHAAKAERPTAFCSLEMTDAQLLKRALAQRAGIDLMAIRRGSLTDRDYGSLSDAAGWIQGLPLYIDDHPGGTMADIRVRVRRMAKHGVALLVVDYLQLLDAPGENRTQQVSTISRGLKRLARELDIHVLALSQLSRAVESRTPPRPQLSDLRDSGTIEQDADVVLMLWRPEYYFDDRTPSEAWAKWQNRGELIVAKQRNGPTGKLTLQWDAKTTRFVEEERHSDREGAFAA